MNFKHLAVGTLLVAGMASLLVSSMAATGQSCVPGKATPESYRGTSRRKPPDFSI